MKTNVKKGMKQVWEYGMEGWLINTYWKSNILVTCMQYKSCLTFDVNDRKHYGGLLKQMTSQGLDNEGQQPNLLHTYFLWLLVTNLKF